MKYTTTDEQVQARLDKRVNPVKFSGDPKIIDLSDVLNRIFIQRDSTVSITKTGKPRHQCGSGRYRSLYDTYIVAKTYFPGITYTKVKNAVQKLKDARIVHASWCSTTGRTVHGSWIMESQGYEKVKNALGNANIETRRYPKSRKTARAI